MRMKAKIKIGIDESSFSVQSNISNEHILMGNSYYC